MPGECGRLALRETLSFGLAGSMTLRSRRSDIGLPQGDAVDLDLVAADQLRAANRARGRIDGKELAVDRVHVVVFQHRIDQHIHLDDPGQRGPSGFEQPCHLGQDMPRLSGDGAVRDAAGDRVDGGHSRQKNEVPAPYRRRHRQHRMVRSDDLPFKRHAAPPYAAAITSSMTLNPASICTLITVRAGGALGTYWR